MTSCRTAPAPVRCSNYVPARSTAALNLPVWFDVYWNLLLNFIRICELWISYFPRFLIFVDFFVEETQIWMFSNLRDFAYAN